MTNLAHAVETGKDVQIDADILSLRKRFYQDGVIKREEAETLIGLAEGEHGDPEFAKFFVEAMTDYLVHQETPAGYVTEENADWLIKRISRDGRVSAPCELSALVAIIDAATLVPEQLVLFALRAVKTAVVTGDGRVLGHGYLEPGKINAAEVDIIRRIIHSAGGDNTIQVSRAEAEFLFDLNDAVADCENDPTWTDLFARSIGSYVMSAKIYTPLTRERAEDLQKWVADSNADVPGFMSRMMSSVPDFGGFFRGNKDAEKGLDPEEWYKRENEREAKSIREAAPITLDEAEWLVQRIGRDGKINRNELALLQFIKDNSPSVHHKLRVLFSHLRPWDAPSQNSEAA